MQSSKSPIQILKNQVQKEITNIDESLSAQMPGLYSKTVPAYPTQEEPTSLQKDLIEKRRILREKADQLMDEEFQIEGQAKKKQHYNAPNPKKSLITPFNTENSSAKRILFPQNEQGDEVIDTSKRVFQELDKKSYNIMKFEKYGDSIQGEYEGFVTINGIQGKPVNIYKIKTDDGETWSVFESGRLRDLQDLENGKYIRITYLGKVMTKGNNQMNNMKIEIA